MVIIDGSNESAKRYNVLKEDKIEKGFGIEKVNRSFSAWIYLFVIASLK